MQAHRIAAACLVCLTGAPGVAAPSPAGPYANYQTRFRSTYADYRDALVSTEAGKQKGSEAALAKLQKGFASLLDVYGNAPPPQYASDPLWAKDMARAQGLVGTAQTEVKADQLAKAHATLEGIRSIVARLDRRNGIETFSDRMTAYHDELVKVLAIAGSKLDAKTIGNLREHAALLHFLEEDVLLIPPAEGPGDPYYEKLAVNFRSSVTTFLGAVRSGNATRIRDTAKVLKPAYSALFATFG